MIRLLDFALLAFLLWFVWSQVIRQWRAVPPPRAGRPAARPPAAPAALTLVRCDSCGVHVPGERILTGGGGEAFCSAECRTRGAVRRA
jgi:hypothetical protein